MALKSQLCYFLAVLSQANSFSKSQFPCLKYGDNNKCLVFQGYCKEHKIRECLGHQQMLNQCQ